jgi:RNA polymerase sigma-70 factor (ECF subfamily)
MGALRAALRQGPPGPYTLQAAIASVHGRAPTPETTAWNEILGWYELLQRAAPSPVVALNRAVAVGMARGAAAGLAALDALGDEEMLSRGHLLAAARADLLRRLGRAREAGAAYRLALARVENGAERAYLERRLVETEGS